MALIGLRPNGGSENVYLNRRARGTTPLRRLKKWRPSWPTPPSTSSSSAPAPAAMSRPSARRSSASRPRSSSATILGGICLELGLHPDQGAAALGGDLSLHAARQGLRPVGRERVVRSRRRREALARRRRPHERRRRLPDEEEQGHGDLGRGHDRRARQGHGRRSRRRPKRRRARSGAGAYQAKHIIVATGARPRVLPGLEPDKKLVWTYFEAMDAGQDAEVAAGGRLRRHRHRVRLVLPHHGRRGDGGRGAAADSARRGRRDRRLRAQAFEKQGIKIHHQRQGRPSSTRRADSVTATIEADGKTPADHGRPRHLRRRRRRQYREPRAGKARREDRARLHRDRRLRQDQCARHLRHRRRRRPADAGAQGRARGRRLHRGDQGPASASDGQDDDPRLHLLHSADRLASASPKPRRRRRASTSASAAFRSSATARRSRSARTRAWSR